MTTIKELESELIYQAFMKYPLPIQRYEKAEGLFHVSMGTKKYGFCGNVHPFNRYSSSEVFLNRYAVNRLLNKHGYPVPACGAIKYDRLSYQMVVRETEFLSFPVVAKSTLHSPNTNYCLANIQDHNALFKYISLCFRQGLQGVNIETQYPGLKAYSILMFYGKVLGIIERLVPQVIGDGHTDIKGLLNTFNTKKNQYIDQVYLPSLNESDLALTKSLEHQSLSLVDIPELNQVITLADIASHKRGGSIRSLAKNSIAADTTRLLRSASKRLDLNLLSFDVLCPDISLPLDESGGVILNVDPQPLYSLYQQSYFGEPNQVCKHLVNRLLRRHPIVFLRNSLCRLA